jgi:hypothetical protein
VIISECNSKLIYRCLHSAVRIMTRLRTGKRKYASIPGGTRAVIVSKVSISTLRHTQPPTQLITGILPLKLSRLAICGAMPPLYHIPAQCVQELTFTLSAYIRRKSEFKIIVGVVLWPTQQTIPCAPGFISPWINGGVRPTTHLHLALGVKKSWISTSARKYTLIM